MPSASVNYPDWCVSGWSMAGSSKQRGGTEEAEACDEILAARMLDWAKGGVNT